MKLLDQLTELKLSGIKAALSSQQAQPQLYLENSFEERLSLLCDYELTLREQRKIERLLSQAKFKLSAQISQIDYAAPRGLSKDYIRSLIGGEWLRLHQNLLITGATGFGKTYLSCALGHHFCL